MTKEHKELNYFFIPIINCLCDIIAGLIYFIQLCKNKNNSKIDKKIEKNKSKIFWCIIFMTFLICPLYICYFIDKESYVLLPFSLNLFLPILFSIFLLKVSIHSHQILSMMISLIGFIFLLFTDMQISFENFYIYIIMSFLDSTSMSILKYSTTVYFISPFLCSFLYGMISLIIYVIGFIICEIYKFKGFSFMQIIYVFHRKMYILYLSIIIILYSIVKTLILLEVYYFSPLLFFISKGINPMLFSFYEKLNLPNGQSIGIYIFIIIGFLFEIISIILYNEIIIINACGLNKNTVKYIKDRENDEK